MRGRFAGTHGPLCGAARVANVIGCNVSPKCSLVRIRDDLGLTDGLKGIREPEQMKRWIWFVENSTIEKWFKLLEQVGVRA